MNTPTEGNLTLQTACILFNVKPDRVTPEMLDRARIVNRGPLYAVPLEQHLKLAARAMETRVDLAAVVWPTCPNCKQDATGMYAGVHGCTRCGWPSARKRYNF